MDAGIVKHVLVDKVKKQGQEYSRKKEQHIEDSMGELVLEHG